MGDSNACVCLYRSLKLLTDDQVTSQRFKKQIIILSCVIWIYLGRIFSKLQIELNQKVSIAVHLQSHKIVPLITFQLTRKKH